MTEIISAKGLATDRTHILQVRPVFPDGSVGPWGPSFAIIKRDLSPPSAFLPITSSPSGIRLSWGGNLDPDFDEQWVLKKFDIESQFIVGDVFDTYGIVVYRGINSTNIDLDLKQESLVTFGVVKVDRYGNRSSPQLIQADFLFPDPAQNTEIVNNITGFSVEFDKSVPSETNHYHIVKVKYGDPFTTYGITSKIKAGAVCTLTIPGTKPVVGEIIQINLGDIQFDGSFKVENVAGNNISYTHDISTPTNISVVAVSGYLGYVIPTSSGPDEEGAEVYRQEIIGTGQVKFSYSPTISEQRVYVAIGTEDAYKNRVSWSVSNSAGQLLVYGRNLIADRDTITTGFSYTNNRYEAANSYWKYGYAGWKGVHNATTKALNTATTGPRLKIEPVTADSPDSIMLGMANGSTTALTFPTLAADVQSRVYPSLAHGLTTAVDLNVSKPLADDPYYVPGVVNNDADSNAKSLADHWIENYLSESADSKALGKIWIECSASDLLDDTLNTASAIFLDGVRNLSGSFNIKVNTWGSATDRPSANLKLYGVTGQWTNARPGAIIDPHFYPGKQDSTNYQARSVIKSNNVTTASKSAYTCTVNMETGSNNYPVVGELVTVSIGNAEFDGIWIVASNPTTNSITYLTTTSATVNSASYSGSVQTNYSQGWIVTHKARAAADGLVTLTLTPSSGPGTLTFSDNFDRADSTDLGSNWVNNAAGFSIVSGKADAEAGTKRAWYATPTTTNDNYSQGVVGGISLDSNYIACRSNGVETGAYTAYAARLYSSNPYIVKVINDVPTQLASPWGTVSSGDTIKIEAVGSTITYYQNGVAVQQVTDNSIATGKYVGFVSETNIFTVDNWVGGDVTTGAAMPQPGEQVWVAIADTSIDNVNSATGYTVVDSTSTYITFDTSTNSLINTTPVTGRLVVRRDAEQPISHLIKSWTISKNSEYGLFNESEVATDLLADWNWSVPSSSNAETLRLCWVLEFEESVFLTSRDGVSSSLVASSDAESYTVKLSNFSAWPGSGNYVQRSEENEFGETQTFADGAVFDGESTFTGPVNFFAPTGFYDDVEIVSDLNITGNAYVNDSPVYTADTISYYGRDYPTGNYSLAFPDANTRHTINSIMSAENVPVSGAPAYIVDVVWSGQFINGGTIDTYQFILWYRNDISGNQWNKLKSITSRTGYPGGTLAHQLRLLASSLPTAAFAVTVESPAGAAATITGAYEGANSYPSGNRMSMIAYPTTVGTVATQKPSFAGANIPSYSESNSADTDTVKLKTATISISSGWTNSYKGDGSTNNYTGGDLMQGYYSSTNGNQRSAWGLGGNNWTKVSGDNIVPGSVKADSIKIISCKLQARANHWWSNAGGTAIIGTHNDTATSKVSNFSNLRGRNLDRKRYSFPGTVTKTIDLGTTIGAELWNGHIRNSNLWSNNAQCNVTIANKQQASGIIFGPGPSTSTRYYGGFAPSSLKLIIKLQWKEV